MAEHDRVDPREAELAAVSAALDGEGPMPPELSQQARHFERDAAEIRRAIRLAEAEPFPDFREGVLHRWATPDRGGPSRGRWAGGVAAAFLIGVAVAAAFLLDRDLDSPLIAASELSERILAAQSELFALDADVVVIERGVHPDLDVRRYEGQLQYRSPERLALRLSEVTELPPGWLANDVAVMVDESVAWRTRRRACPVDELPACLTVPVVSGIVNRPPFSAGWAAPLDLVQPVGPVLSTTDDVPREDGTVTVVTTVGQARGLVETTLHNGAFRQVHAEDRLRIRIDEDSLVLQGFSIEAGGTMARTIWATTWGYHDQEGDEIVRLDLRPRQVESRMVLDPAPPDLVDAGFRDDPSLGVTPPPALPEGFALHRRGTLFAAGATPTTIASWVDGRAWVTMRSQESESLGVGPGFTELETAEGIVHVDARRHEVLVVTGTRRIAVTGTVPLDQLIVLATSLPETGRPAQIDLDDSFEIEVGDAPATVIIRPAAFLPPPDRGDVVGVAVRGTTGRYSPTVGTLMWLEDGRLVELTSDADLEDLLEAAAVLELP